jgi:DNA polymerase-3 subunit epsilon
VTLRDLAGGADRFAVIDTETTGVYPSDRIVEIAVVTVGLDGRLLDEFDTLVQPGRDVTATHIHGITASMVADAPRWDDIAGDVAVRLHGACIVAHNASFDRRMVAGEYERLGSLLYAESVIDTLYGAHGRLSHVCASYGIALHDAHRALSDARACAELLVAIASDCVPGGPAEVMSGQRTGRVLRREDSCQTVLPDPPLIAYLASRLDYAGVEDRVLSYLDLLERVVADLRIDATERVQLLALAEGLGLSRADIAQAHRRLTNDLIDAALDDHLLTPEEYDQLLCVAAMLDVDTTLVDERTRTYRAASTGPRSLAAGTEVVFTGDDPDRSRDELIAHAHSLDLVVHSGVRKQTGLLVAYDPQSLSGKAKKAARYNVPILSTAEFAALRPGDPVAAVAASDDLADRKVVTCPLCHATWTVPGSSSERTNKACSDCAGATQGPAKAKSPAAPAVPTFEELVCEVCGCTWQRQRVRGRKPRTCPDCA